MKLSIVTASTNLRRAEACIKSWRDTTETIPEIIVVLNGSEDQHADRADRPTYAKAAAIRHDLTLIEVDDYLGTVPAFAAGVSRASGDVIACMHDDLEMHEPSWDDKVLEHFRRHPWCGLAGFGGAIGLGADDMYEKPYDPMSLARRGFRSNMVGAELHGIRSTLPERVACLDGFSQIGRAQFFRGEHRNHPEIPREPVWQQMADHGIIHHMYDGVLGALAARMNWETWYIPARCHHYGGRTAVGDQNYQHWANQQIPEGDQGFWIQSHARAYEWLVDVLPLRV